ncbi:MAG: insulinase family protein [Clostridia bacterium]|nr:insulinase family protein [Clostridia bacterium]
MEFQTAVLSDKLRVIGVPMPTFRSVSLGLWVDSGSVYENDDTNGISHFIEHMLFKGTKKRSARQIAEEMDAVGGMLNAFTDVENTCFYTSVLGAHLPLAMDMISDLVLNSRLDPADVEREKGVVLEEINMAEDTPDDLVFELLNTAHFGVQPISRPVLGKAENVSRFTREDIRAYMDARYRPDGAVLAVAGSYDWDALLAQAEDLYSCWQPSGIKRPEIALAPHEPCVIRREKDMEQTHVCIGFDGPSQLSDDYYAFSVVNTVLGGSMSSRLFQSIREERGLAYNVFTSLSTTLTSGLFSVYAGMSPENANQVVELTLKEIEKLGRDGISRKEFGQAREQTLSSLIMAMESTSNRMKSAGRRLLMRGDTVTQDELISRINAIKYEQVNELAAQLITSKRSAAIVGADADSVKLG